MSNAFRYRITNATLYRWEWPDGWQIVQPKLFTRTPLQLMCDDNGVGLENVTITKTDEGTVFEYVPF